MKEDYATEVDILGHCHIFRYAQRTRLVEVDERADVLRLRGGPYEDEHMSVMLYNCPPRLNNE